jgi:hypothetical protein
MTDSIEDYPDVDAFHTSSGLYRRVFGDFVQWLPFDVWRNATSWDYAVFKWPFVPGFHLCRIHDDDTPEGLGDWEEILSTHKTLHEAMAICRVLLANGGATYDDV